MERAHSKSCSAKTVDGVAVWKSGFMRGDDVELCLEHYCMAAIMPPRGSVSLLSNYAVELLKPITVKTERFYEQKFYEIKIKDQLIEEHD